MSWQFSHPACARSIHLVLPCWMSYTRIKLVNVWINGLGCEGWWTSYICDWPGEQGITLYFNEFCISELLTQDGWLLSDFNPETFLRTEPEQEVLALKNQHQSHDFSQSASQTGAIQYFSLNSMNFTRSACNPDKSPKLFCVFQKKPQELFIFCFLMQVWGFRSQPLNPCQELSDIFGCSPPSGKGSPNSGWRRQERRWWSLTLQDRELLNSCLQAKHSALRQTLQITCPGLAASLEGRENGCNKWDVKYW